MDTDFFVQQVVNGLTLGSVYALIALGYTMVYGILKLLNFAHGEVYMMGAFAGYAVLTLFGGPIAPLSAPVLLVILTMLVAAMVGTGALGVVIERFAYRPLRNAPRIAPLISALGVAFFLQATALLLFGADFRSYETYEYIDLASGIHWGPLNISIVRIGVILTSFGLMLALTLLVARTRLGKAMRATAFDREAAAMQGIDVDRVIVSTFFIGSLLAGAAGVMVGLVFYKVYFLMGFLAGPEGLHRRGCRRHRLDPRRHARRPPDRPRRGVHHRLRLVDLPGPLRLLDPHRDPARAADRPARARRHPEGLT